MLELLGFISSLITLYIYIIIGGAVMSWLIAFNVCQPLQSLRTLRMAGAERAHRASAAPHPALDARPRRGRHIAGRPDPGLRLRAVGGPAQHREARRVKPGPAQPWRADPAGVRLLVRVSPKSTREGIDGVMETAQGPALTVRVRAVAGRARRTRAVEMAVAAWLGVPKSSVAVTAGANRASRRWSSQASPPGWRHCWQRASPSCFEEAGPPHVARTDHRRQGDCRGAAPRGCGRGRRHEADARIAPGLAVVLVGEDPASQVYVRTKSKATTDVGMLSLRAQAAGGDARSGSAGADRRAQQAQGRARHPGCSCRSRPTSTRGM